MMKGLLLKDFYTVFKQMKLFLLVLVVFAFIPGFSSLSFVMVFAAMVPITSLAYDERSKWNRLAAMLPYSAKDMVLSKYVFGYGLIVASLAICTLAQAIVGLIMKTPLTGDYFRQIILVCCAALIIDAVELPIILKFGVEKGRLFIIFLIIALSMIGVQVASNLSLTDAAALPVLLGVLAAAVLNVLSILVSIRLYNSKA